MSIRLTNELFRSARTVVRTGQIKRSLDVKVNADGSVAASDGGTLDILPLGNQGDNCVTEINFTLPTELQDGYFGYFIADLKDSIYIQKCEMLNGVANAWIEEQVTFDANKELNLLFVAIETDIDAGDNITEATEIFVTDEFVLRPRVMSPWANNLWRLRPPPVADTGSRSASAAVEIGNGESRARRFRAPQRYGRKFESSSATNRKAWLFA